MKRNVAKECKIFLSFLILQMLFIHEILKEVVQIQIPVGSVLAFPFLSCGRYSLYPGLGFFIPKMG